MIPFLAIHAKGGEIEPKAKGPHRPHHHHQIQKLSAFQKSLSFGILLRSKGGESSISKMVYQNPLETGGGNFKS
jgi:hypothetical protein